jgi:hypothetical protein
MTRRFSAHEKIRRETSFRYQAEAEPSNRKATSGTVQGAVEGKDLYLRERAS